MELPNGIPSDDTFRRVFERIKPEALEQVLSQWLQHLMGSLAGEIVPIDGKNLKGSYDRNQGIKALHLVTAWASEQRLVLGQVKVEDKSNEITAIPALLELLDISGAIITIDAMGTQTEIVRQIRQKKADYVLALKANHPTLHSQVKNWFDQAQAHNFEGIIAFLIHKRYIPDPEQLNQQRFKCAAQMREPLYLPQKLHLLPNVTDFLFSNVLE